MKFPRVQLGNLVASEPNSFVDGPFGSNLKASEYKDSGIPIIRLQNILSGPINEGSIQRILPF